MPMGILGVLAHAVRLRWRVLAADGRGHRLDDRGRAVGGILPGAVGRMPAFGIGPLLFGTAGLLFICLLRTPLRWSGALVARGRESPGRWRRRSRMCWSPATDRRSAFRGTDGRLAVLRTGRDTFAVKEWLAADADARTPKDASLSDGVTCDAVGCIGRLGDGRLYRWSLEIEAFAEDCARAAVVVSCREAPHRLQGDAGRSRGLAQPTARSRSLDGRPFQQDGHASAGYDRPWTHVTVSAVAAGSARATCAVSRRATRARVGGSRRRTISTCRNNPTSLP